MIDQAVAGPGSGPTRRRDEAETTMAVRTVSLRNEAAPVCARPRCRAVPVVAEVDLGSASSWGRPPEQAWMVRLRRGDRSVIVAIGLYRHGADRVVAQITELLAPGDEDHAGRGDIELPP